MNEVEINQFREKLFQLRSELEDLEKISRETGETVELDQSRVGRLSRMDAMQGQQMALEAGRRRRDQLLKIEGALHRIDSNEYGCCFVCGEEIDSRRLSVDPTSTRCMKCVEQ